MVLSIPAAACARSAPLERGKTRWVAYPKPHVVIQYYDGVSGDLLYAEPIHLA